jgi:hypothetical protein
MDLVLVGLGGVGGVVGAGAGAALEVVVYRAAE